MGDDPVPVLGRQRVLVLPGGEPEALERLVEDRFVDQGDVAADEAIVVAQRFLDARVPGVGCAVGLFGHPLQVVLVDFGDVQDGHGHPEIVENDAGALLDVAFGDVVGRHVEDDRNAPQRRVRQRELVQGRVDLAPAHEPGQRGEEAVGQADDLVRGGFRDRHPRQALDAGRRVLGRHPLHQRLAVVAGVVHAVTSSRPRVCARPSVAITPTRSRWAITSSARVSASLAAPSSRNSGRGGAS